LWNQALVKSFPKTPTKEHGTKPLSKAFQRHQPKNAEPSPSQKLSKDTNQKMQNQALLKSFPKTPTKERDMKSIPIWWISS